MPRIAKIVVEVAVGREFDYLVPDALADRIRVGSRVIVPFGKSEARGFVVGFAEKSEHPALKEIRDLVGRKPLIGEKLLELARWIGEYYAAPVEQAVHAVLPGAVRRRGAGFKERLFVFPTEAAGDLAAIEELRRRAPKQAAVLDLLLGGESLFVHHLARAAKTTTQTIRTLEQKGFVRISRQAQERDPLAGHTILRTAPLELMPQQQIAFDLVKQAIETRKPPVVLLFGVTGSGKTEVYLQAIDYALKRGQGAILLVPEISLTPQTVERFRGRFGDAIAVLHSHLSQGERHDEWHRIHDGKARIAIGARSAVFAPVRNPGLIVVDEEHENSYKQEESPRYNARDVAVMRGRIEGCAVVLGSATPALESFYNTQRGKYGLAELPHRVDHRKMPVVRVVDMRIEAQKRGGSPVFSADLVEAIRARLDRAEQVILFLNRRGFATSLVCHKCGHVARCSACSVALTYHRATGKLHCHICGAVRPVPANCPNSECRDPSFRYAGVGTQRVEEIVARIFPQARVHRMDADTTTRKDAHRHILGDFRTGKIDILVGTQMIAKGLHFPNVTLVGVIFADITLHMPDFRAGERTFQLLTQVAGRAGRGDIAGEVIVQTYTPYHPAIQAARRLDYVGFYSQEIEFRRELSYPPFTHLVCMTVRGPVEEKVGFCARAFADELRPRLGKQVIRGEPAPAPLAKAKGQYRYQLILRAPSTRSMVMPLQEALKTFKWPKGVQYSVDVDALSLL